jgi:hypothetical protein
LASPSAFGALGAPSTVSAPNGSSSASTPLPGLGGFSAKVINENASPITVIFSGVSGGAVATANTGTTVNAGVSEIVALPYNTVDYAVFGVGGVGNVVVQRGDGI